MKKHVVKAQPHPNPSPKERELEEHSEDGAFEYSFQLRRSGRLVE